MPSRIPRLKRRSEFLRVAATRRRCATPGLILQVGLRKEPGRADGTAEPRVGFTASRKVGNSVARNRARRRLRAVVDKVLPRGAKPGHDYVVIARRETLTRPFAALVSDLERALRDVSRGRKGPAEPRGHRRP